MKIKNLLAIIGCTAIILTICSCKKAINSDVQANQILTEKFFKIKGELKPEVKRIYDYLKSKNEETGLIGKFAKKEGLIVWDKSEVYNLSAMSKDVNDASSVYVVLPIVLQDENFVNAILRAEITTNSIEFNTY